MREQFIVEGLGGERKLAGSISVRGAKNAVLKILPATVLFDDEVPLENVPDIEDVGRMRELLAAKTELLGAIRLPNDAFKKNAGTEVTTDIVMLRKLRAGEVSRVDSAQRAGTRALRQSRVSVPGWMRAR